MATAGFAVEEEWDETVPAKTALLERLQETPPGPELGALLASIDRSSLDAEGLLRVAQARQQQIAHHEAEFLSDLYAVARAVPDEGPQPGRRDLPGKYPWAEVEAACALRWSYGRAGAQMILADEVIDRLPAVHEALSAGEIDMPKVYVITEAVSSLDGELARAIIDKVIDRAGQQTTSQLRARLRRLVLAADPQAAMRRAKRGSRERRVAAFVNENLLANLAGYDLAPHRVAAVMERLDAIAKAAKAAGDPRPIGHLRADAYLDLLTGEGIAVGEAITNGDISQPDNPGDAATAGDPGDAAATDADGADGRAGSGSGSGQTGQRDSLTRPASPDQPDPLNQPAQPGRRSVLGPPTRSDRRRSDPVGGPEEATAAGAPWPAAPADRTLLADPGTEPPAPADPESPADLWAHGVPEPPDPSEDPDDPRLATADQLIDAEEQDRQQLWLAGFRQLSTTNPTVTGPTGAGPTENGPTGAGSAATAATAANQTTANTAADAAVALRGPQHELAELQPSTISPAETGSAAAGSAEVGSADNAAAAANEATAAGAATTVAGKAVLPGPRRGVVELQAPLLTLLGLSQLPGELGGWAPVVADIARQVVDQMREDTWRWSAYDRFGELAFHGTTNERPTTDTADPTDTGHATNGRPTADRPNAGRPNAGRPNTGRPTAGRPNTGRPNAGRPNTGRPSTGRPSTAGRGTSTGRFPSAEQAAYVRARDRMCVAPGCRRQARQCDIDHTLPWVKGGETETCNLGLLCRMHHLLKHSAGCELLQTSSGIFSWKLPSGLQYLTTPDTPLIDDYELADLPKPHTTADTGPDPGG